MPLLFSCLAIGRVCTEVLAVVVFSNGVFNYHNLLLLSLLGENFCLDGESRNAIDKLR